MRDTIIIGGGPAGAVAGIYAARKNLDSLLITKDFIGQLGNAGQIENWPGDISIQGPELLEGFVDHLKSYDINLREEEVTSIEKEGDGFVIKTNENKYRAETVIVASGRRPRRLGVPGEEEFLGQGVSYCVTCDGALFQDKSVVVAGGGNAGLEGALELSEYAKEVRITEINENLQGDEFLIDRVESRDNIIVETGVKTAEIMGEDFVTEIKIEDMSSGELKKLEVDGVFVEIGSVPVTDFIDEDLVDFNEGGEVQTDPKTGATKTDGLYGAGDVTDVRDKQIVVAAGEGAKALLSAYNYIKGL